MRKVALSLLAIISLLIIACEGVDLSKVSDEDLGRLSDKAIVCNEPYIRLGASCCLDQNNNEICDKDEKNNIIGIKENPTENSSENTDCPEGQAYLFSPTKNRLVCVPEEDIVVGEISCQDGKIIRTKVEGGYVQECIPDDISFSDETENNENCLKEFDYKILNNFYGSTWGMFTEKKGRLDQTLAIQNREDRGGCWILRMDVYRGQNLIIESYGSPSEHCIAPKELYSIEFGYPRDSEEPIDYDPELNLKWVVVEAPKKDVCAE